MQAGWWCPVHPPPRAARAALSACQTHRSPGVRCRSSSKRDQYAVLGVAYDADAAAIKSAFRAKAKQLHPDVNTAADASAAFRRLKRAHDCLSDSLLRAAHDAELRETLADSDAAAALRASDPRFARFERWRREILPDLKMQLDVWGQEVEGVLRAADASLVLQEQQYRAVMVRGAPSAANVSLDWLAGYASIDSGGSSSSGSSSSQQELQHIVLSMKNTLADAAANVQRLYDKRFSQLPGRFPAYPDIVWWDTWVEYSDAWLDASAALVQKWQPKIAAASQWLPNSNPAQQTQR